jgi:DNA repair photolyase
MIRRIDNPPSPYHSQVVEYLEEPPEADVEVYEEQARSILSENDSPDLPFRWSVNPYRGCQHACAYCYARPYHEYLDLGAGTDFDTKLFVKVNAPQLLREALSAASWQGEAINFSGVTDCYQPLEAVWNLTRQMLEICLELRNPVTIVTKSFLVARDAALLAELDRAAGAGVYLSIPFADDATARLIEPQAPCPSRRFAAMERLHQAGVPVSVLVAPIIPGLNDSDIPTILKEASMRGARHACCSPLRLPRSVADVFFPRLRRAFPQRARRIEKRLREIRGGELNNSEFGRRMTGRGPYWESIARLFDVHCALYGLSRPAGPMPAPAPPCVRQPQPHQLELGF